MTGSKGSVQGPLSAVEGRHGKIWSAETSAAFRMLEISMIRPVKRRTFSEIMLPFMSFFSSLLYF